MLRTTKSNTTNTNNNSQKKASAAVSCPSCGCPEIESHDATGEAVCINCGTVVEENGIVSSIEFHESSNGAASVVGQYVNSTSQTASHGGPVAPSGRHFASASRDATLALGRRRIANLAGMLHLGTHYVDASHRLFTLALSRNFTTGRKASHVVAACVYVVCRREKSPHLLIDFSDRLQTDVFALGSVFLKFCRLLNLTLPIIDPSLYIHRFAAQLHLSPPEVTHTVATTALRLVATMKRDWMEVGRRPSGICGAALLIASRTHGVDTVSRERVKNVVSISDYTLTKRLQEFALTPAAQLTFEEFGRVQSFASTACDPPAFRAAREKQVVKQLTLCNDAEEEGYENTIDDDNKDNDDGGAIVKKDSSQFHRDHEISLMMSSNVVVGDAAAVAQETEDQDIFRDERARVCAQAVEDAAHKVVLRVQRRVQVSRKPQQRREEVQASYYAEIAQELKEDLQEPEVEPKEEAAVVVPAAATAVPDDDTNAKQTDDDESDLDDDEIDSLLLSSAEVEKKRELWLKMNHTYLKDQEEKLALQLASGKPPRKRKRTSKAASVPEGSASNEWGEDELAQQALSKLKKTTPRVSKNINYDVLAELLGTTSSS